MLSSQSAAVTGQTGGSRCEGWGLQHSTRRDANIILIILYCTNSMLIQRESNARRHTWHSSRVESRCEARDALRCDMRSERMSSDAGSGECRSAGVTRRYSTTTVKSSLEPIIKRQRSWLISSPLAGNWTSARSRGLIGFTACYLSDRKRSGEQRSALYILQHSDM